jgi:hypothetical protein
VENLPSRSVAAGFVDLDEVGAFLELQRITATSSAALLAQVALGRTCCSGVVADGVFVAAQDVDRVAADAQARPWHKAPD